MLDEFRSTNITWDKATSRIYSPVTANAGDENGRKLVVQIVNGGQVEDLTGATLHLYWETRDKAHDGLDVFDAVDLKKGEFELSYTTGMLSNHGVLNANLVLIDTVGRVVSERFKITVTEGIDNDAIQSENSFSSLTQALIDVSNLEQNYAPRLNDLTAQLQQKANSAETESMLKHIPDYYQPSLVNDTWSDSGALTGLNAATYLDTFFNPLVGTHEHGYTISKKSLGKDQSGSYDVYEYDFVPQNYTKTILLTSGMHGNEKISALALAQFIKNLMSDTPASYGLKQIREKVRIKTIPVVNPWGFTAGIYANSRGVNPNRNMAIQSEWDAYPVLNTGTENKGAAPFSEAESIILRDWAYENPNAVAWVDCHTGMDTQNIDIWSYYSANDTLMLDKIPSIVELMEKRIADTYGKTNLVKKLGDDPTLLRLHWTYQVAGISNIAVELSTSDWGTDGNQLQRNVTEYYAQLSGYIFGFLEMHDYNFDHFAEKVYEIRDGMSHVGNLNDSRFHSLMGLPNEIVDEFSLDGAMTTPTLGPSWLTNNFTVSNGVARANGSTVLSAFIPVSNHKRQVVEANITFGSNAGLFACASGGSKEYLSVRLQPSGVNLVIKKPNESEKVLDSHPVMLKVGQKYHVVISVDDGVADVFLDGKLVLTGLNENAHLKNIYAGLRVYQDTITTFDNFRVKQIDRTTNGVTFSNGWTGDVKATQYNYGLTALVGSLTVGTATAGTIVFTLPTNIKLPIGTPLNLYNYTKNTSVIGLYIAASNGNAYVRNPLPASIATGDVLYINQLIQAE